MLMSFGTRFYIYGAKDIIVPESYTEFKNYAENEAGRLVPDLFLFYKKAKIKENSLPLIFDIF